MGYGAGLPGYGAGRGTGYGAGAGGRYGAGTGSGYGAGLAADWTPLSLSSLLAAWYKADAGCFTDAACLFASASSQYLSRGSSEAVLNGSASGFWRAAWVYITDLSTFRGIMGDNPNSASGYDFYVNASGQAVFRGSNGTTLVAATGAGGAVTTGAWFFIYAHYTGVKAQISVNNGSFADSANYTFVPVAAGSTSLYVGRTAAGNFKMEGAIARAFGGNGNLSGAQITTLYNAGAGLFYADLGATLQSACGFAYNLCEGSSTRVDSVGALNLTPTNGPTVAAGPGEGLAVNNSPVKRWEDQSGNARHLVQATIANQPLWIASGQNGLPVVRGDGTSDYLVYTPLTLAQPLTWAGAFKYAGSGAGNQTLLYGTGGSTPAVYRRASGDTFAMFAGTETDATAADNSFHAHICTFNGSSSTYHLDGSALTLSGDPGSADFSAEDLSVFSQSSGGGYASADIGEAMLIGAAPTAGQRGSIQGYLKPRWATP